MTEGAPLAEGLRAALAHHWHPVCAEGELPGPVGVRLLGRDLAVARLGDGDSGDGKDTGTVAAFDDRCPHRSTRLSVGQVDGDCLRCAYHGWTFAADGACTDIPSMPGGPIPARARVGSYDVAVRHGLVWVRLDSSVDTAVPACPAFDDPAMKVLAGAPYTWPVSAPRRVENFVDLAHFAFVHDGTLGRLDEPVPPVPDIERVDAELRFSYDPPALPDDPLDTAMLGTSAYRMPVPCTVDIAFHYADGRRRQLWMTASPVDDATCRTFWYVCRTDDLAGDDRDHLAFQDVVLAEDAPVVCNQVPPELPLEPSAELSVRTDKVSIEYRRWLRELATAALEGPEAYATALLGAHPARGEPHSPQERAVSP
jgi:phenylpropionate dioxygenase-like ring-hydroxylating dioxygenase large terminal subunit